MRYLNLFALRTRCATDYSGFLPRPDCVCWLRLSAQCLLPARRLQSALEQAPSGAADPGQLQAGTVGQSLSSRLSIVNFAIVAGRIDATGTEAGLEREQSITGTDEHQEKLSLSTNADQEASIEYELSTASEKLTVDVVDGWQITLSRRPTKDGHSPQVEFVQPHDGPVTLTVTDGGKARQIEGASLWHLLLAEPQFCHQYLSPLLDMLRSDWRLAETAQMIEAQMVRTAAPTGRRPAALGSAGG